MNTTKFSSQIPIEFTLNNEIVLDGELRSVLSPRTIDKIVKVLPINSRIHLWKREFYFEIGIRMGSEKAVSTCNAGDIAYWPQGDAICLFFETMVPYGKVNPIGQIKTEKFEAVFESLRSGMTITLREKTV